MKITIYLTSTQAIPQELREIRSQTTHTLLALEGDDGLYLWDRRSSSQHLLCWSDIMRMYQSRQNITDEPLQRATS